MKRISLLCLSLFLCILLTVFTFSSCTNSSDSNNSKTSASNQSDIQRPNTNQPSSPAYTITSISPIHNGLARFKTSENKYGYMDINGNVVIEPIYTSAQEVFDENAARVCKDDMYLLIDRKGNTLCELGSDVKGIGSFKNGYIWVSTIKETLSKNISVLTYYNEKGGKAFSIEDVDYVEKFSSFNEYGYALVDVYTDSWYQSQYSRVIDTQGNFVDFIPENTYITTINGNYVITVNRIGEMMSYLKYIDFSNKKLLSAENITDLQVNIKKLTNTDRNGRDIYSCTDRGTTANTDKCNMYLLLNGNNILMNLYDIPEFKDVAFFKAIECGTYNNKTYYTVYLTNKSGVAFSSVIDENGNMIIAPTKNFSLGYSYDKTVNYFIHKYYQAYSFSAGLCKAKDPETGLFGFIDLNGKWVIEPQYKNVTDFSEYNGEAYAVVDETMIINSKGKVVFTAKQTDS